MRSVLVLADDRTGALETAGMCADGLDAPVTVVPLRSASHLSLSALGPGVTVVDTQTRHLSATDAATTLRALTISAACDLHKIDSLLRGNWAAELAVRARSSRKRILVVPAFPALGRTCVDGVVYLDGIPVGQGASQGDVRSGRVSSRPADHLRAAGLTDVMALTPADAEQWLSDARSGRALAAICDATNDREVDAIVHLWGQIASDEVILAGTARVVASGVIATAGGGFGVRSTRLPPTVTDPILVVCGSAHPTARRQVAAAAATGAALEHVDDDQLAVARGRAALERGRHLLLVSPEPAQRPVPQEAAAHMAGLLATATANLLHSAPIGALIIIGGDTAAAVLGDAEMTVEGTVATGTPFLRRHPVAPLVVTRAGGFGDTDALRDLMHSLTGTP